VDLEAQGGGVFVPGDPWRTERSLVNKKKSDLVLHPQKALRSQIKSTSPKNYGFSQGIDYHQSKNGFKAAFWGGGKDCDGA